MRMQIKRVKEKISQKLRSNQNHENENQWNEDDILLSDLKKRMQRLKYITDMKGKNIWETNPVKSGIPKMKFRFRNRG